MSRIIIGFSKPKKWKIGAAAIMLVTKSPYSHVYIKFESSIPGIPVTVYHAAHGMVHFLSEENFVKNNLQIAEYAMDTSIEERRQLLTHCMNLAGDPYGISELFKILITDALSNMGIQIKTYNGSGYICSELVGIFLANIWGVAFTKETWLLKPLDIESALLSGTSLPAITKLI